MKNKKYSVHKHTVIANRLAFRVFMKQQGKSHLVADIEAQQIDLDSLPTDRVPLDAVTRDTKLAANVAQEPNLGLKIIDLVNINITPLYKAMDLARGPLKQYLDTIPLLMTLRLASRYFQVLSEVVLLEVEEIGRNKVVVNFIPTQPDDVSYHQIEGAVLGLTKLVSTFNDLWPQAVNFSHVPDQLDYSIYERCFRQTPNFAHEHTQLVYEIDEELALQDAPLLLNPMTNLLEHQFPDLNYRDKVILILNTILGFVEPTRENVAGFLNLSISSLQRRLKEEGHSYNSILLETRKQRAHDYLAKQHANIEDLAFLLGYRAKSQFFKAFKQWYKLTPAEYKAQLKS